MNEKIKRQLEEAAAQCTEDCYNCPKKAMMKGKYPDVCYIRRTRFMLGQKVGNEKLEHDYRKICLVRSPV